MGTDIHCYAEVRRDDVWKPLDAPVKTEWREMEYPRIYSKRDYDVFAILANVRNGYGFAGADTGTGFAPMLETDRGLPDDLSEEFSGDREECWLGDHSFGWITLRELLGYDYDRTSIKHGIVNFFQWSQMVWRLQHEDSPIDNGPDSWCNGVSGGGVSTIDDIRVFKSLWKLLSVDEQREVVRFARSLSFVEDFAGLSADVREHLLDAGVIHNTQCVLYTRIAWPVSYARTMERFTSMVTLRLLSEVAKDPMLTHDDLRIVFGFDS